MVVQATNVTDGIGESLFDLAIPGSGNGVFSQQSCVERFGPAPAGFGRAETVSDCDALPSLLQTACRFRFNWMREVKTTKRDVAGLTSAVSGALDTKVDFSRVRCPSELVSKSKFVLADDDTFPLAPYSINDLSDQITDSVSDDNLPIKDVSDQIVDSINDAAQPDDSAPTVEDVPSAVEKRDGPPQQEFAQW